MITVKNTHHVGLIQVISYQTIHPGAGPVSLGTGRTASTSTSWSPAISRPEFGIFSVRSNILIGF